MPAEPAPVRRILLADIDAFFTQCARLADPEGAGKARLLIVGGSSAGRGVVTSASYEARAYGVRAGMPTAMALRRCPGAMVVPVPRGVVSDRSRAVMAVLARHAPRFQQSSVDEAYLDLTGTEALHGHEPLADTARRIREAVLAETGFAVSFGGGTNRLIAKMAVEVAKPKPGTDATGVHVVPPGQEGAFMTRFALADIPGVGPVAAERLAKLGLRTVPDVLAIDEPSLRQMLGPREAEWLARKARGIDRSPVQERERQKSVSREDTFPRDLHGDAEIAAELGRLVEKVVADLRADRLTARRVVVKLKSADFRIRQKSCTLREPVQTPQAVHPVAAELLARLRAEWRVPVRLAGVSLELLEPAADALAQLSMFDAPVAASAPPVETERDRRLADAVDAIRARFGAGVLRPGRG